MLDSAPSDAWQGKPYFPISQVYREKFGCKVVKVPVAIAETCPNREGLRGMKTCIFCDVHGSFAYPESQANELRQQITEHREKVAKRFNAARFLIYFQAYTTTFTQIARLKAGFEMALSFDDVAGIVVGTRPDTLSAGLLDYWRETSEKTYLGIELGVQSFDDKQLVWMRRGHTSAQAIKGIERVAQAGLDVGVHLIFGWPDETDEDAKRAAEICNALPISNVKLHHLHVLKNTPLAELYEQKQFAPIELEPYAQRVGVFLDHLAPRIAVHRLAALSSQWHELVAPQWTRHKMKSYQAILDHLNEAKQYQGRLYRSF